MRGVIVLGLFIAFAITLIDAGYLLSGMGVLIFLIVLAVVFKGR